MYMNYSILTNFSHLLLLLRFYRYNCSIFSGVAELLAGFYVHIGFCDHLSCHEAAVLGHGWVANLAWSNLTVLHEMCIRIPWHPSWKFLLWMAGGCNEKLLDSSFPSFPPQGQIFYAWCIHISERFGIDL